MKENSSIIKLSSLTNFKWDYALISLTNEDFEKITFYKNGVKLYRDGFKVKSDGEIKSQYLFNYYSEKTKGFSTYKCPYSSSIKFRNENDLLASSDDPEKLYIEEIMPEKLKLNLEYINDNHILKDIKIILDTFYTIVKH